MEISFWFYKCIMQMSRASENNFGSSTMRNTWLFICCSMLLFFIGPFLQHSYRSSNAFYALRGDIYTFFSKERQLSQYRKKAINKCKKTITKIKQSGKSNNFKRSDSNIGKKQFNISHFGCTNIIFADFKSQMSRKTVAPGSGRKERVSLKKYFLQIYIMYEKTHFNIFKPQK